MSDHRGKDPEAKQSFQKRSAVELSGASTSSLFFNLPFDDSRQSVSQSKCNFLPAGVKKRRSKRAPDDVEAGMSRAPTEPGLHLSSASSSYKRSTSQDISQDSLEPPSENYLLKKTTELLRFNVGIKEADNEIDSLAKRFVKSNQRIFSLNAMETVNPFDKSFVMYDERDIIDSSAARVEDNRRTQSRAPLAIEERPKSKEGSPRKNSAPDSTKGFWGKMPAMSVFFHIPGKKKKIRKKTKIIIDEVDETVDEDLQIKRYIHDMYFYIIFLVFINIIALGMVSSNMFYLTDLTVQQFFDTPIVPKNSTIGRYTAKTLRESRSYGDFWAFAESTMVDLFYWNFFFADIDPLTHTEDDDKIMFYENQILGVPRIRQVRVRNDSCAIHPDVQRFFNSCYNHYSVFAEETRPIKEGMESSLTASAWSYTEADTLKTSYYWGEMAIYGGGGYYVDLSLNRNTTLDMLQELKQNGWVSKGTRAIFIDFNLYNANINLFCICKIVLEFPAVGGMLPSADFHSLKLIRYLSNFDFFILGCEFAIIIFILHYTYKEVQIFKDQTYLFFFIWWNYLDVLIIGLLYTYVAESVILYFYTFFLIASLDNHFYKYTEFSEVKDLQIKYNNIIAVLVFACWIKLFKYLNFTVILVEFRKTLARSLKNIIGFLPMFATMFATFAILAYLLFGNQVKDYNTVWMSFLGLLHAFLGEFEYKQIEESNHILGPLFYVAFIFFIFFVLLNVFIAIINEAYTSVKSEFMLHTPKPGEYCKRGFFNIVGCCCCGLDKKFIKKTTIKRKLIFKEIKSTLRTAGFSDVEIKLFLAKYSINIDNVLSENTHRKIIEDLELNRLDYGESAEQFQITTLRRRIDNLSERMEEFELSMQPVSDKVDVLLKRVK